MNTSENIASVETENASQYIVKPGDTLYQIALNHNITLDELYSLNPGVTPLIFPGISLLFLHMKHNIKSTIPLIIQAIIMLENQHQQQVNNM